MFFLQVGTEELCFLKDVVIVLKVAVSNSDRRHWSGLGAHTHMYDTCMFVLIFLLSYCALMGGETLEKVI